MTVTTRLVAAPLDIQAIRVTCPQCGTAVSLAPSDPKNSPDACPNCRRPWFVHGGLSAAQLETFLKALAILRTWTPPEHCPIHLEFELPAPAPR